MSMPSTPEVSFIRCIANPTPVTHNILGQIPSKGCFPLPDTKTGTISSDPSSADPGNIGNKKVVFGVGTLFTTEVRPGDYIYAADVVRKVEWVTNDTQLILDKPFPSSVSGAALKIARAGKYKRIFVKSTGASANAIFNEATLVKGDVSGFDHSNEYGLVPVSYDASAANSELTFDLSE